MLSRHFFSFLLIAALAQVSLAEENLFSVFVNSPTPANYNAIISDFKKHINSHSYEEWADFQKSQNELANFLRLVGSSNALAIDLAVKLAPKTDGGNLEDLCRAVAKNIRSHPELILQELKENQAIEYRQKCMLLMLPESTVDNFGSMIAELEKRIAAISKVENPELSDVKQSALTILNDEVYFLRGEKSFMIKKRSEPRRDDAPVIPPGKPESDSGR